MINRQEEMDHVLDSLRNPSTIRKQAQRILALAKQDKLAHFILNEDRMMATASYVIEVIKDQYPDLNIPYHSRWRHFEVGGIDRIKAMQEQLCQFALTEQGKVLYELVIISVFLDAGAGKFWHYKDKTGKEYSRSEGLALASLDLYKQGFFSSNPQAPFRVDAQRLIALSKADLSNGFQVSSTNPLDGIEGRVALLNRLGTAINKKPQFFGSQGRLGDFYTYISSCASNNKLSVQIIFRTLLDAFADVWPKRLEFHGVSLGDVWRLESLNTGEEGSEFIPFHKLTQWLAYSLIEPLEQLGIEVSDIDQLTGLPEYRNGGLLIDSGLLSLKNPAVLLMAHEPSSDLVVEWRALTVALLDSLADLIREELGRDSSSLPLAKILQGGTWEAGRRIAKQKRSEGTPPLQIISDGTVF